MHIVTKHTLEEMAIQLEKSAEHFSHVGYPWCNDKVARLFRRTAKTLRAALKEETD